MDGQITYDYLSVQDTSTSPDDFLNTIKTYGKTGWKLVLVYNGYIFFEKAIITKMVVG